MNYHEWQPMTWEQMADRLAERLEGASCSEHGGLKTSTCSDCRDVWTYWFWSEKKHREVSMPWRDHPLAAIEMGPAES